MSAPTQISRIDAVRALRDAGWTALLAFGLFLPLIGFVTVQNMDRQLVLDTRFGLLAVFVAIVFGGRLAYSLLIAPLLARAALKPAPAAPSRAAHRAGTMVRPVRDRLRHRLSGHRAGDHRDRRGGEMGRQFRHPDPDLCDARLGPQHRGRPRRPARPRLCRLLRGRRLFLRAAGQELRHRVLGAAAALRHPRRVLGHPARLSGAAAARRLSGHRHARPSARSSAWC